MVRYSDSPNKVSETGIIHTRKTQIIQAIQAKNTRFIIFFNRTWSNAHS